MLNTKKIIIPKSADFQENPDWIENAEEKQLAASDNTQNPPSKAPTPSLGLAPPFAPGR